MDRTERGSGLFCGAPCTTSRIIWPRYDDGGYQCLGISVLLNLVMVLEMRFLGVDICLYKFKANVW